MSYSNFRNQYLGDFESMASPYDKNTHVNSYTFKTGMVLSIKEVVSQYSARSGYAWWDEVPIIQKRIIRFENVPGSIYEGVRYDDPDKIKQLWQHYFDKVDGDIIISGELHSFDGVPKRINGRLDFSEAPGMTSLSQIHQHFEYITERLVLPNSIRADILGVLKVKGLLGISFHDEYTEFSNKADISKFPYYPGTPLSYPDFVTRTVVNLSKLKEIINNHLSEQEKNVIACQRELIENDFDEYASL